MGLSNRKHRSSSLDERDGSSFLLRSNNNQNKELATFTNGKGKQFSYVKQYLLEQEEEEKRSKTQSSLPMQMEHRQSLVFNGNYNSTIEKRPSKKSNDMPPPPVSVNSVDTIKQIVKHLLKNKGRNDEPSEQEINQAMEEFQK